MVAHPRVLVVDDEPIVCRSCQKILSEEGYEVSAAFTGQEGLKKVRQEHFDVMITDMKIPDISGMDILECIRGEQPGMPVVMITGYASVDTAIQATKLGAFDYIPKPFSPEEISEIVREALESKNIPAESEAPEPVIIHRDAVMAVLNRAAEVPKFIAELSEGGSEALKGYTLSSEEKAALVSGDQVWLEAHFGKLNEKQRTWLKCRLEQERW